MDNEITKNAKYREDLFKILPSLESIDGKDKKGGDVDTTFHDEDDEDDDFGEEDGELDDGEFDDDEEDIEDDEDDEEEDGQKNTKKPKKA